jgi:hypothetical protein
LALFDIVTVPTPLRVTFEEPMTNSVAFPAELSEMELAFEMEVPLTVKVVPLLKLRLSPKLMVTLFATAPLMSRVTVEAPGRPLSMKTLLLEVGTPADHFVPVLQSPAPPSQLSFVAIGRKCRPGADARVMPGRLVRAKRFAWKPWPAKENWVRTFGRVNKSRRTRSASWVRACSPVRSADKRA